MPQDSEPKAFTSAWLLTLHGFTIAFSLAMGIVTYLGSVYAWKWTALLTIPATMLSGYFIGGHAIWGAYTVKWRKDALRYRATKIFTADADAAFHETKDVVEVGDWVMIRTGGVTGHMIDADEAVFILPRIAIRPLSKNWFAPMNHFPIRHNELPPEMRRLMDLSGWDNDTIFLYYKVADIADVDPAKIEAILKNLHENNHVMHMEDHLEKVLHETGKVVNWKGESSRVFERTRGILGFGRRETPPNDYEQPPRTR